MEIIKNRPLLLHVKLKGIETHLNYQKLTAYIIDFFKDTLSPKTIIVPTFTYSFLKGIPFNVKNSPSQVGRFSEECRNLYQNETNRSLNPVFSFIDLMNLYEFNKFEKTSFGETTLFHKLSIEGHYLINVNIDLNEMRNVYLHYLEEKLKVSYRNFKLFRGKVSKDGIHFSNFDFNYYARDLETDTIWRRNKMAHDFKKLNILTEVYGNSFYYNYIYSKDIDSLLIPELTKNDKYMIEDNPIKL